MTKPPCCLRIAQTQMHYNNSSFSLSTLSVGQISSWFSNNYEKRHWRKKNKGKKIRRDGMKNIIQLPSPCTNCYVGEEVEEC